MRWRARFRAQLFGQRDQVEIVHPHQVVGAQEPRKRLRELAVDPPVRLELAALEVRQVDAKVQQRPEAIVAEAIVIAVEVRLREVERREGDAGSHLLVQPRPPGRMPAPPEPEAAALAQRLDQADREPAGGGRPAHRPDAIRHRDQPRRPLHVKTSQPRDSRVAAFTIPTSE